MALQNVDFSAYSLHNLVLAAIHAACTMLMLDKRYVGTSKHNPSPTTPNKTTCKTSNYFKKFRARFWLSVSQLE